MKYFTVDIGVISDNYIEKLAPFFYILFSYDKLNRSKVIRLLENTREVMVDSGAHAILSGKVTDYEKHIENYLRFIREYKGWANIIGFFEMDIDRVIGIDRVLEVRREIEKIGVKVIPVWHKERGVDGWIEMCNNYDFVAIPLVKEEEIYYRDLRFFLNYALRKGVRVHGLGVSNPDKKLGTRFIYSIDASSWNSSFVYNNMFRDKLVDIKGKKEREAIGIARYGIEMLKQIYYITGNDSGLKYLKRKYPELVINY